MSPFFWSFPQSGHELFHSKRYRFNTDFWREIRQFLVVLTTILGSRPVDVRNPGQAAHWGSRRRHTAKPPVGIHSDLVGTKVTFLNAYGS